MIAASVHTCRRFLVPAALVIAAASTLTAQGVGVISGTVINRTTNEPIEGAAVRIIGTAFGNVTRASGQFAILRIDPGTYDVMASAAGYASTTIRGVDVRADVNRVLNFALTPTKPIRSIPSESVEKLGETQVRLFTLEHLSNSDAAKLVAPFVQQPVEGVFDPGAVRGVTVRGTPATLARIDSLLRAHDRRQPTILLKFQVLAASDSALRDPQVSAELLSVLHEEFNFAGYRSIARSQVGTVAGETAMFTLVMDGGGEQMRLSGSLTNISARTPAAAREPEVLSASLRIQLRGIVQIPPAAQSWDNLISTSLSVPIGQTVVIGNATTESESARGRTILLVVRAETQ